MATVLYQRKLGSVRERRVGVLSERGVFLGISVSLGLDPVPLRQLVLLSGNRLGLAARRSVDGIGQQYLRQQPGQQGFQNTFATTRPRPPLHPPAANQSSLVGVNLKSMPASSLGPKDTFVFRNNSAGLGVPRGSLGKLNSFSGQAAQHGLATTNVYYGGQRGEAEGAARSGNVGTTLSARPTSSASMQSNHSYSGGGSMQSASPGAGAAHSSMQSGVGGGGAGGGGRR